MSKEIAAMNPMRTDRKAERGQILVLFTVAIVVVIAMLGLVLDGGSSFAQRRDQQNVADLSALAGADAYLNTLGTSGTKSAAADAAARAVALTNGYHTDAASGQVVDVVVSGSGVTASVVVTVTKPHTNNFAGLIGMPTWGVSATATALTSQRPNGALGAMPLLFNSAAFPNAICDESAGPCDLETYQEPGTGPEDVPQDATQFNWTIFCLADGNPCNANSSGVRNLIDGNGSSTVINLNDQIGPLNAGSHTTLFTALDAHLGETFPVPIVCTVNNDPTCPGDGAMVGWAYFHLVASEGASDKVIKGYFVSPVNADKLVVNAGGGSATLDTGVYVLRLTN